VTSALYQRIRRTIQRHALLPAGSRVLVGLSGGSDSVALAFLLLELSKHGGFVLAGLAHFNHQLRPTAGRDEAFCRDLAVRVGLTIVVGSADVKTYAETHRLSIEDAARRLRYEFLEGTAVETGATRIAVGHTEDDQAETFLLKLMRGAGMTGLGAVYPRRGMVIRPLLDVTHEELRAYLEARGEAWVEDETNADLENPRNRVRRVVLPELDRAAGGSTRAALARAARLIREDTAWLDAQAAERFEALATQVADGLEIDGPLFGAEPSPIQRRVVLTALRQVAGGREVGLDHVDAVMTILAGKTGGVDLPGSRVELRRGKLVLLRQKTV
jgi:tRNA(Ile)-lysidine synthase